MKFLKEDGIIEEGQALESFQIERIEAVERYLHGVVCRTGSYHYSHSSTLSPCRRAAIFLALANPQTLVAEIDRQFSLREKEE